MKAWMTVAILVGALHTAAGTSGAKRASPLKTLQGTEADFQRLSQWRAGHPDAGVELHPAGVRFEIDPQPRWEGHDLTVAGYLINETSSAASLKVEPNPGSPSILVLQFDPPLRSRTSLDGAGAPPPPNGVSEPTVLTIPPQTRIRFQEVLYLDLYEYRAGESATLHWTFRPLGPAASGELRVKLPARGPQGPPPNPPLPG